MIVSNNASGVNFYNTISSRVRFKNRTFSRCIENTLAYYNVGLKPGLEQGSLLAGLKILELDHLELIL
jgi:hypothetical protein